MAARQAWWWLTRFEASHSYAAQPVPGWVVAAVTAADVVTWGWYAVERAPARRSLAKFGGWRRWVLGAHAAAAATEAAAEAGFLLGWRPGARVAGLAALLAHLPTTALLLPAVWGWRYITVTGYVCVAAMRARLAVAALGPGAAEAVPRLWVLLHTATLVRVLAYCLLPWGEGGRLATTPPVYTMAVGLAATVTTALTHPPGALAGVLAALWLARLGTVAPRLAARLAAAGARRRGR